MTHLGGVFLWLGDSVSHSFEWPLQELDSKLLPSPTFSTARNASCGMSTHPMRFIRFLAFLVLLETLSLATRPGSPQTVGTLLRGNAAALNRNFAQEFRPPLI